MMGVIQVRLDVLAIILAMSFAKRQRQLAVDILIIIVSVQSFTSLCINVPL